MAEINELENSENREKPLYTKNSFMKHLIKLRNI